MKGICHAFPPWCFCLVMGLKVMEPTKHGMKPLKLWAKINPSFLKFFLSDICHSDKKCD
jgi:hypothetical protein